MTTTPTSPPELRFDWSDYQAIADQPEVYETIRALLDDHTEDNATCMVRQVVVAATERLLQLMQAQIPPAAWVRWEWNRSGSKSLVFEKPAELPLSEQARGVVYDPLYEAPTAEPQPIWSKDWRVVPVKPSVAMLVAGNHCQPGDYSAALVWEEMIAAAERRRDYRTPLLQDMLAAPQAEPRCARCNYQNGHAIGCESNPVDIALKAGNQPKQASGCTYPSGAGSPRWPAGR